MTDQVTPPTAPVDPQSTPTPPSSPPSVRLKLLFVNAAIVLLVLAGVGMFYAGRKTANPVVTKITPSISPTPSDETLIWKIYTNHLYSFSVNYPNDWIVGEEARSDQPLEYRVYFRPELPRPGSQTYGLFNLRIYKTNLDLNKFALTLCHSPGDCPLAKNIQEYNLNSFQAIRVTQIPGANPSESVLFKTDEYVYEFNMGVDKSYQNKYTLVDKRKLFTKMLYTLKFLDQSQSTTNENWKSFIMNKNVMGKRNFTLNYPLDWGITRNDNRENSYSLELNNHNSTINFAQGAGDFAPCYYDDYPAKPGVGNFYKQYREINVGGQTWRISLNPQSTTNYTVCERNIQYNKFFSTTQVGWISILIRESNAQLYDEVVQILSKIQILN